MDQDYSDSPLEMKTRKLKNLVVKGTTKESSLEEAKNQLIARMKNAGINVTTNSN